MHFVGTLSSRVKAGLTMTDNNGSHATVVLDRKIGPEGKVVVLATLCLF